MNYKHKVSEIIHNELKDDLSQEEIYNLLEKPKQEEHDDIAFPTFQLARIFRKNPNEIATDLASKFDDELIKEVKVVGPYVNF